MLERAVDQAFETFLNMLWRNLGLRKTVVATVHAIELTSICSKEDPIFTIFRFEKGIAIPKLRNSIHICHDKGFWTAKAVSKLLELQCQHIYQQIIEIC